jgi:hypothetical protein
MTYKLLLIVAVVTQTICFGQIANSPTNLSSAIKILDSDCPDSLKLKIKSTPDKDLRNLGYPYAGKYKTIFEWTKRDSDSGISKYLSRKGVSYHQDIVLFLAFKNHLLGQDFNERTLLKPYQEIERKMNEEDKVKYTTDSIHGVYIPKDLQDCFRLIDSFWNDSTKLKVKNWTEDEFSARVHLGFGMSIRNSWQLWGGSRLSKYFNNLGIYHPDDMSGIIFHSYHRYLTGGEIKLDEQIKYYKGYWDNVKKEELERMRNEFGDYHVGDTVLYNYNLGFATPAQEQKRDDDSCTAAGQIIGKDEQRFTLKIKLLNSCDSKGIIWFDNKGHKILNKKTKKWEKPKKRIIKYMRVGQINDFEYKDWESK